MNKTEEKEQPKQKILDYRSNKNGWVTFKDGRKKEKLRKYISELALFLTKAGERTFKKNKEDLIFEYETGGVFNCNKYVLDELDRIKVNLDNVKVQIMEIIKMLIKIEFWIFMTVFIPIMIAGWFLIITDEPIEIE